MWQVAVAAAVAGSGILAKHLFTSQQPPQVDHFDISANPISEQRQQGDKDGIFMFSSAGSRSVSSKKSRNFGGVVRRGKTMVVGQKKVGGGGGKRVSVCLKKRRTGSGRISTDNHDSTCKECSSFGWGLGLGMMYMMSAGKAEVSKLSNAIDETTQVVHELKTKLSSQCLQLENVYDAMNTMDPKQKPKKEENLKPCMSSKQPIKAKETIHFVDSEYASSVMTEEQQLEGVEMGQLESELESELQKPPWCTIETSGNGGNINSSLEFDRCESMKPSSTAYQSGGISPAELKNKLSHLLIEQQESHILELESELNSAYSKLEEKDAELRALKDCVRRLTEFSLASVSDEETEACREERQSVKKKDCEENKGSATATIGMKRGMEFET